MLELRSFASTRYAPHLSGCLGIGSARRNVVRTVGHKPSSQDVTNQLHVPSDGQTDHLHRDRELREVVPEETFVRRDSTGIAGNDDSTAKDRESSLSSASQSAASSPESQRDGTEESTTSSPVNKHLEVKTSKSLVEDTTAQSVDSKERLPPSANALRQRLNNSSVDYVLDDDEDSYDSSSSEDKDVNQ